jgi:hypothetical protein
MLKRSLLNTEYVLMYAPSALAAGPFNMESPCHPPIEDDSAVVVQLWLGPHRKRRFYGFSFLARLFVEAENFYHAIA